MNSAQEIYRDHDLTVEDNARLEGVVVGAAAVAGVDTELFRDELRQELEVRMADVDRLSADESREAIATAGSDAIKRWNAANHY